MPILSVIDGIKIKMYFDDEPPPHIHADSAEYKVKIAVRDSRILAGHLPAKKLKKVFEYVNYNRDNLLKKWQELNSD